MRLYADGEKGTGPKKTAYTGRKKAGWEIRDLGNKKVLSRKIKITGYGLIRSGFNAQSVL